METLAQIVRSGKALYVGIANLMEYIWRRQLTLLKELIVHLKLLDRYIFDANPKKMD